MCVCLSTRSWLLSCRLAPSTPWALCFCARLVSPVAMRALCTRGFLPLAGSRLAWRLGACASLASSFSTTCVRPWTAPTFLPPIVLQTSLFDASEVRTCVARCSDASCAELFQKENSSHGHFLDVLGLAVVGFASMLFFVFLGDVPALVKSGYERARVTALSGQDAHVLLAGTICQRLARNCC